MLGLVFLVVLGLGFDAFIGLAPDAVVKSMLVLLWTIHHVARTERRHVIPPSSGAAGLVVVADE